MIAKPTSIQRWSIFEIKFILTSPGIYVVENNIYHKIWEWQSPTNFPYQISSNLNIKWIYSRMQQFMCFWLLLLITGKTKLTITVFYTTIEKANLISLSRNSK